MTLVYICDNVYESINPCPAEYIKKPHPFLIFSQSEYLIWIVSSIGWHFGDTL